MVNDEEVPGVEEAGNVRPADRAASGHDGACVARRDQPDPLRALHVVAAVVSQSPALAKALNAVLDRLLDLARTDTGAIYLVEDGSGELCLVTSRGLSEAFRIRESRIPRGRASAGCPRDGRPAGGGRSRGGRAPQPARLYGRARGLAGVGAAPLARPYPGLLTLYAREPRAFQAIDRTLLSAIGWTRMAVENAGGSPRCGSPRWRRSGRHRRRTPRRIAQSLAYLNMQTARVEQLLQGGETEGARASWTASAR
jgi:hypothetical protein